MTTPAPRPSRSTRPTRARAPSLPPLDALDRTHHQMLAVLAELAQLVDRLEAQGLEAPVRQSARSICQFFDKHARQHHADEEAQVFPALVRKGDAALIQQVLRLQQDHGWLEEDWLELAPQLQAIAQGYSWYEPEGLRHAVAVFTTLYHEHIALEESMAYPEARRQLDREAEQSRQRQAATVDGAD